MAGGGELACTDRPPLFLLPRTLFSRKDAVVGPAESEEKELESIQGFFKSAMLSSSMEFVEEARTISNGIGDPFKLDYEDGVRTEAAHAKDHIEGIKTISNSVQDPFKLHFQDGDRTAVGNAKDKMEEARSVSNRIGDLLKVPCEDGDRASVANAKDQLQGRRPALGRKRAHFSFNPNVSDSNFNVDLKSSVDHIEDPDELFLAFENIECARKELKKQMGEVTVDSSPNAQWAAKGKRRPGILGRKASYRHHSPEHIDPAVALVLSQGEDQTFSPQKSSNDANSNTLSQPMSKSSTQAEVETNRTDLLDTSGREDIIGDKEKGVDNLLDSLLHCFEDLDKGGEIDFLQERLKIKSTNVDKIRLPPLDGFQTNDITVISNNLAAEKLDASQIIHVSPNVVNSPLAAISMLRRRISQIDPLKDPFSVPSPNETSTPEDSPADVGSSKSTPYSPAYVERTDTVGSDVQTASGPDHRSKRRSRLSYKEKSQSTIIEADTTTPANIGLVDTRDFHSQTNGIPNHSVGDDSAFGTMNIVGSTNFATGSEDNVEDRLLRVNAKEAEHGDGELASATTNFDNTGASIVFDKRGLGDSTLDKDIDTDSIEIDHIMQDKVNDAQEAPASGGKDQSNIDASTDIPMDGCSGNPNILPDRDNEENQEDLIASVNGQAEQEAPRKRRNKQIGDRRYSLAGAGMAWQSGVRRSTRIKMKPLEYWRGERLLYARIHDSLPTLIGVKYSSPSKSGQKQVLKVKSYVSKEHAPLLEKIALH